MRNFDRARQLAGFGGIRARLMLVLLCLVWGTSWPLMRIALDEIPPLSMRTSSAALGALTLYLICVVPRRSLRMRTAKAWAHIVIASLLNIVGFNLLSAFAQLAAATSRVAILAYTMPIWSVLLAWTFLGERPTGAQAVRRVRLVRRGAGRPDLPSGRDGCSARASCVAMATGVSWSAGTVYLQRAGIDADLMGVASWQITIAFVVIAASMMLFEGRLELAPCTPMRWPPWASA